MTIDDAILRLKEISCEIEENLEGIRSEEDTKIQIIVRFVTEVLGWRHADLIAEKHHDNGYSDLIVSDESYPAFLIEAKRIGEIELATASTDKMRELKISGPVLKGAMEGIDQAVSYAGPNGINVSVLTDGLVWIIFKTYTPGAPFKSKEAFVFPSIEAIQSNFVQFYELLSKESVQQRLFNRHFDRLHQSRNLLTKSLKAPIEESEIRIRSKSNLAFDLDRVFDVFFGRLTQGDDDEMLIDCFVETRESRVADLALQKIAANVLGNISPPDKDISSELNALIEYAVGVETGQTIFIVGPTGAGKTTFLQRFFRKTMSRSLRDQCVVVRANCLDATGSPETALHWFAETLIGSLESELFTDGAPSADELQGLYFSDYKRRRKGVDFHLYKESRNEFKKKFGEFLDKRVENDREGYLRRILADVVRNRKKLPIIIVDNTDEFKAEFKGEIFQFAQALRRAVNHCLIIFPVTDKSAWSFSKTDLYGIYKSKSFFLPTPPPREILRKRVDYIREKISTLAEDAESNEYFTSLGIRISIPNLKGFASVVEDVFVNNEYVSKTIGELSNFNIRGTLALAQRVITSSFFKIEDLVKAFATGKIEQLGYSKFLIALMRGDYEYYRQHDKHSVLPVFQVDERIRQSPLLLVRVLAFLNAASEAARKPEDRYVTLQSIIDYFDIMGVSESAMEAAMLKLQECFLIEPYDPSVQKLSTAQKFAITFSGERHLLLSTSNEVFFEQMATTTAITNFDAVEKIRSILKSNESYPNKMEQVRALFADYLIKEDLSLCSVPMDAETYECQRRVSRLMRGFCDGTEVAEGGVVGSESPVKQAEKAIVVCTVDWFDIEKGFGFLDVEEEKDQAFLRTDKLKSIGLSHVYDGDKLLCSIGRNEKGLIVSAVYDFEGYAPEIETVDVRVVRIFPDRQYGFVRVQEGGRDVIFHFSVFEDGLPSGFDVGTKTKAEISADKSGKGYLVRNFISDMSS